MEKVTDSADNYRIMRKVMNLMDVPCIPWLGLYLRDIVFINDAQQTFLADPENQIINVQKLMYLGNILTHVKQCQTSDYAFLEVPFIKRELQKTVNVLTDENDQYKKSLVLEPKDED
jgi:son of sevenless-like protein